METWYIVNKKSGFETIQEKLFKSSTEKTLVNIRGWRQKKSTDYIESFDNKDEAVKYAKMVISDKIGSLLRRAETYRKEAERIESIKSIKIVSNN